jgi:serine/threonine-protein kinase RsbT
LTVDPKTVDPKTVDPKIVDPKIGDPKIGDPKIGATGPGPTAVAACNAPVPPPLTVAVVRESDVFYARELAAQMAIRIGFGRTAVYRLATAVSELGNNLVDHTPSGGCMSLTTLSQEGLQGVEVVVKDDGPGIDDTEMAMTDGFSSKRGLGSGLPGCRRLMDEFTLESAIGHGTRVTARLWLRASGQGVSGQGASGQRVSRWCTPGRGASRP